MSFLDSYKQSRRNFIESSGKLGLASCVVNFLSCDVAEASGNSSLVQTLNPGKNWAEAPGKARHRYDGWPKVTGQKVYGRDFHAKDMQGLLPSP